LKIIILTPEAILFLPHHKRLHAILLTSLFFGCSNIYSDSSTWTGEYSIDMNYNGNWSHFVPNGSTAIFNGNGNYSPLSYNTEGINFEQVEVTSSTQISVITQLDISGTPGVNVTSGSIANFDIYEHNYPIFDPAELSIFSGAAGSGGGEVNYNLQGYGQLYAFSGTLDSTIVNVNMTGGHNYFEINGSGNALFDSINSDSETDEISLFLNTNLTIKGTESNIISGIILGEGSLTKNGTGILILENDNTYTGDTQVDNGVLILNGSVAGNLLTGPQGTLKGTGNVQGNLISSGTVSPGNSIGALSVGNFLPTSSNTFECEINSAGQCDQIIATGSASLMGAIQVIPLDLSFSAPQTYDILQTGTGITGTFSRITATTPGLMTIEYGSNNLLLTYLPLSVIPLDSNAAAGANCFVTLSGDSDINNISSQLLALSIPEIESAFNQMQPAQFSALTWTQLQNALLVRSGYLKHLDTISDHDQSHVWIDEIGQWQHQGSKNNQFGYRDWTSGVSLGTDASYKNFRFGGAVSYTYSGLDWTQSAGNGRINSYYGGFYGNWSDETRYVALSGLGSYSHYNTSRHLHFGSLKRHAYASHHGWEALVGIETGLYAKVKRFKMGPIGRIDYIYLSQNSYQESGAGSLDLRVNNRQDQLLQSQAGAVFTADYECGSQHKSGTLSPRLEVSYINQVPLAKSYYHTNFVDSSCQFRVSGWNFLRNLGALGLGLTYLSPCEKIGISLQYDGQFGSQYWNLSGNFILDIKY
jgi:autotransporter-associated beta strand protein